jgi:hypothetical protein
MTNVDGPFGLRPISANGGSYDGHLNLYAAADDYATALFVGDAVDVTGVATARGVPYAEKAAAADATPIAGAIVAFVSGANGGQGPADVDNLKLIHGLASTLRYMLVADDPNTLFEIQADGTYLATKVGMNANLIYTHAGSTLTGQSGAELNTATIATTATFQLKTLRLVDVEGNDLGANSRLVVRINNHRFAPGVAGVDGA